jgi:hypothetical protein
MKKIYLSLSVIALALLSTSNLNAQCASSVSAGAATNLFTNIRWTTNPIAVNKDLNTIVFAHRNSVAGFGGSSGNIRYDVSTNGGTTWTNNLGNLNPLVTSAARYPNACIYNPTGNSTPSNAYIGYLAATINGAGGWNGHVSGVRQLSGAGNTENYNQAGSTNVLIPNSLTKGAPGVYWAADAVFNGTIVTGFRIYKGTWNGSNDITWANNFTATPPLSTAFNGTAQVADYNIAFDPTGQMGWMSFLGHVTGGPTNYAYYPVFYKTTDGGASWNGPIQVDINQFPCISSLISTTNVATTAFEHDLTVDIYGNPHMITTICNGNNAYSVYFGSTHHIFDITLFNGIWNAYDVANVNAGRGTFGVGTNSVSMDMFPQISRTADGKKIFFAWTDNSGYALGSANQTPNLMSKAFDVTTWKWTPQKDFTSCNAPLNGQMLMPHIADEVLEPSGTTFKMAGVYGLFTVANDPGSTCNFNYLDNLVYNASDFSITQTPVSVSIQQGSSMLLCPAQIASLSITGSYSQVLWNNAAITNSTSVGTGSTYIVAVRNGCTLGADTIVVTGLTVNITPSNPSICIGNSTTLTASTNAPSFTWNPGGLTTSSIVITPTATTIYTLSTPGTNCMYNPTNFVTVNNLPTITISGSPSVCSGSSVTHSASGATTYSWNTGATTASVNLSPTVNTTYTVTGIDANSCVNTQTSSVTVFTSPTVAVTGSMVVCAGTQVTLTASGASTYSWTTGSSSSSITITPTVGTTTLSVTGTSTNSCLHTLPLTLAANALPTVSIGSTHTLLCSGSTASLTGSGANSYNWNTGSTNAVIAISPTTNTTYTLTGTGANGCSNTFTFTQQVSPCAGIEMFTNNNLISIYPNPNNGEFTVLTNEPVLLNIINELGQVVYAIDLKEHKSVKIKHLAPGVYFVTGTTSKNLIRSKLIVE